MWIPILIYNEKQGRQHDPGMLKKQNYILEKKYRNGYIRKLNEIKKKHARLHKKLFNCISVLLIWTQLSVCVCSKYWTKFLNHL